MKKIKIVIVGAGAIANKYLEVLKSKHEVSLEGIFSRTFKKAEKLKSKYKIKNNFKNIEMLYEKTKADIVISTVSVDNAYSVTKKLSNYPWTILIEKPPGANLNEFNQLQKLSKKNNKKIHVAMNRRFFSSTIFLLEKLKTQRGPRFIQIVDQQNTIFEKEKKTPKKIIFYWMYANSIHLIDYANFLTRGKIKKINFVYKNKKEINCFIYFTSNDIVNYICRWNKPGPWQVKVSTNNFYFELSPLEVLKVRSNVSNIDKNILISNDDKKYKTGFKLQIDNLISAHKKLKNNLPCLEDLEKTMLLIKKIYKK